MAETGVLTLNEFLLARIAEDEAEAPNVRLAVNMPRDGHPSGILASLEGRVLAECAAKRQIVALHGPVEGWPATDFCAICNDETYHPAEFELSAPPCRTLRLLALPHSSHPDYRPEWRVEG